MNAEVTNAPLTLRKKSSGTPGLPQSGKFDQATLDKLAGPQTPATPPAPAGEPSSYLLKLLKDPALASVAKGEVTLSQGAKGDGVVKLQETALAKEKNPTVRFAIEGALERCK